MGSDFRAVGSQWGEQEAWQGGLWDEEPELKAGRENTLRTGPTQT